MFERRLKVFLAILLLVTVTLVLRAAQVQVLHHKDWEERAVKSGTHSEHIETKRGAIRDMRGVVMAVDEACVDACVDYRALVADPDPKWVTDTARNRLKERLGTAFIGQPIDRRQVMLDAEVIEVQKDVRQLIPRLAKATGREEKELEDVRTAVVEKVRMRQRWVWYWSYQQALERHAEDAKEAQTRPSPMWQKWLLDDEAEPPQLDAFYLRVSEETAKHVLVRDVDLDVQAELARHIDRFPGLELREGTRRIYPLGGVAAHAVGRLSRVTHDDMKADPNLGVNELRQYQQTDLKGRGGLEGLCEPVLRGTRGETSRYENREIASRPPEVGKDVYCSLDVMMQEQVEALFNAVPIKVPGRDEPDVIPMHGAAVVIDVASGEVRVLASAPSFDPNQLDERYAEWADLRNLKQPLLNRATLALREPGSTVKPLVGIAAVAEGIRRADEPFECTGYMIQKGKLIRGHGRCWVNSMFHKDLCGPVCNVFPCPRVAHHPIPGDAPHPDGRLKLADALERSCNPYFQTIADVLGPRKLSDWYRKFGLGEPTYIGVREARGRLPDSVATTLGGPREMLATWTAGIGQGPINVSPLQMANVAATIARGGVWVRPKLLRLSPGNEEHDQKAKTGGQFDVPPTTQRADRVDLGLPPEAMAAVREGMFRVVHTRAGSGDAARHPDVAVAGKTGTAEAALLQVDVIDQKTGKVARDAKGNKVRRALEMSGHGAPTDTPWYRATGRTGDSLHHSWFMGYAPAENPQIAFAVMVEYGGSGGGAAGSVAKEIVKLCIEHNHLKPPPKPPQLAAAEPKTGPATTAPTSAPIVASPLAPAPEVELLHDLPATKGAATRAAD